MNYKLKYLKYKQKYLFLKNNNILQFGGDTPNINVIKNISLFTPNSDLDLHFNPIYGFLYIQLGYIDNIYNFTPDNDEFKIIKKCFHKINNLVLPTNNLRKIDIDDFAKLSVYLYLNHVFKDNVDNIKKNIHTVIDLLKKLSTVANKDDLILIKNDIFKKICNLKISGIQFDIFSNMKYSDLINSLSNYKRELQKIITPPTFNSKIKEYLPDSYFKEYKLEKFYIILVILWYKFNNKAGIVQYYQSLNKYLLNDFKIIIPHDYANTLFTYNDFINPGKDFYSILAHIYYKNINSMQLLNYESVDYIKTICTSCTRDGCYFPDCGETTLRNFLNIIFYDVVNNCFNYKRLCELGANDKLKEFYTKFNSLTAQSSTDKIKIFNEELNARDAWSIIISNLPNVKYLQTCILDEYGQIYNFELNTGLSENLIPNMLEVIKKLFKINNFGEFEEIEIINDSLDEYGLGIITFKKLSTNTEYNINIMDGHYALTEVKEEIIDYDYAYLEEKKYIDLLLNKNTSEILTIDINNIYLINYKNNFELLCDVLYDFGYAIEDKKYEGIIKYIDGNCTDDEKSRVDFLLSKISNFYEYNLKPYRIEIKLTPDNKILTMKINNFFSNFELKKMMELKLLEKTTELTLGSYFDELVDILPNNLTHLTFGSNFNQLVDKLPNNLTHLTFGSNFNQLVDKLPINLTHLTFGRIFNQLVDKLPINLTHLTFGSIFNQLVDKLPINLTYLTFGSYFNQLVDKLPINLTHLTFGYSFNKLVDKLPINLKHLTFGSDFNKPVNLLPTKITHLTFGKNFDQPVNLLPTNITHLIFETNFNQLVDKLPNNLTHLTFGDRFDQQVDKLPINLIYLIFGYSFNQPVNKLPKTLTYLTFGKYFNKPVNLLPTDLTYLTFGNKFDQLVNNLPKNLTHLTIPTNFNKAQTIDNLPNTIVEMTCGFNHKIKLPHCLKKLIIQTIYNKFKLYDREKKMAIPHTVTEIIVQKDFLPLLKNIPQTCIITDPMF